MWFVQDGKGCKVGRVWGIPHMGLVGDGKGRIAEGLVGREGMLVAQACREFCILEEEQQNNLAKEAPLKIARIMCYRQVYSSSKFL